jgi:hypothetical protein
MVRNFISPVTRHSSLKLKPLRLRAGVVWEQGLHGSARQEGIPLARGTDGLSIWGRVAELKKLLTKNFSLLCYQDDGEARLLLISA